MNVYEIVTEKMIGLLESGTVPWRKPWVSVGAPANLISKKPYRGINHFLLSASKYVSPYWLTYKQADGLGGKVRKGEKSTLIVFWKVEPRPQQEADATDADASERGRSRFVLRYYNVFNLEQCDLPAVTLAKLPTIETKQHDPIAQAETATAGMPNAPAMTTEGTKAFYSPMADRVTLPAPELFSSPEEYYATALHELTHSTGHKSRLAREGITDPAAFGSGIYSREELVAEMGAAFLCAEVGISNAVIENQAAYVAGWLKKLRDDRRLVVIAAAQAQKAADWILNRHNEES